jgi:aryl-alcohol dehydrogenase-like predicted oxidoreductase
VNNCEKIILLEKMNKRFLGKTGLEVSEVAFGGVEIGMPYGIGVKSAEDMISAAEAINLLNASFDAGINFYDTARQYGESESIIGKAFEGRRSQVIIATKCQHFVHSNGKIPPYADLKKIVDTSLKASLAALRTDYVDIYMLHQGSIELLQNEDIQSIFSDLKKTGVVRATGVSTYTPEETQASIENGTWDVIQLPFNIMDQRQAALFPLALNAGVGIVVRSVLMKGLLSGRGKDLHPALKEVENHIKTCNQLAQKSSLELSTLATKFALGFPEVSSILVGLDRMEYLYKCLEACNGGGLEETLMLRSKQLAYADPEFLNLHTWSMKGWLK